MIKLDAYLNLKWVVSEVANGKFQFSYYNLVNHNLFCLCFIEKDNCATDGMIFQRSDN